MRLPLAWGARERELDIDDATVIPLRRAAQRPPLADLAGAVERALESPIGFPPLRRALTPDDQIAIAVDESLAHPDRILVPVLEHLAAAHVHPAAVTLLCLPPSTEQPWLEGLPDRFQDVRVEVHDPRERPKLSYLATTRKGRRIYLNRSAVDADQLIVVGRVGVDGLLGVTCGEGMIFPGLADEATRHELLGEVSLEAPGAEPWPLRQEAMEVAWLLGAPFLVQVVLGAGEEVVEVYGGPVESAPAGERAFLEQSRVVAAAQADVVLAAIPGLGESVTMLDLARAFQAASRVVKPGGRIVLLTEAAPLLGPASSLLRDQEEPSAASRKLRRELPIDVESGLLWASAAEHARLYLLSDLSPDVVEEMFATPLESVEQARRFLGPGVSCAVLPDAHRLLTLLED